MSVFTEGNLKISFPDDARARKFDDASHTLSHCMKAVDFIVELKDKVLFIEIKDPDNPETDTSRHEKFVEDFRSGKLNESLKYKYRDSFLYEWAMGRGRKPIFFLVLIALAELSRAELITRTDALKTKLPLEGPQPSGWIQKFVHGCGVFNIDTWNNRFPDYPVERIAT